MYICDGLIMSIRRGGQEYCMDLIAEVAAAEELQLAQIKAHTTETLTSSRGSSSETMTGNTSSDSRVSMGSSVGSDLSTEVRVFVFGWAETS